MSRILSILNICEKSLAYRDYHEYILGLIKIYTENKLKTCKEDNLEKLRKMNNINYLLEQKRTDFFWRMNRMFQGLDYDELKTLKKDSKSYEIKRNVNEVIKEIKNDKEKYFLKYFSLSLKDYFSTSPSHLDIPSFM
ncbi:hypothetical protein ACV3OI_02000 [Clostridium perfringens]